VTTGISRSRWTEIIEGVEEGELILASNPIDMLERTESTGCDSAMMSALDLA